MNKWQLIDDIQHQAERHKRNSSLKRYLITDLEIIERKTKELNMIEEQESPVINQMINKIDKLIVSWQKEHSEVKTKDAKVEASLVILDLNQLRDELLVLRASNGR